MPRPKKERPTTAKIWFSEYDHRWHGLVPVGLTPDGQPDRRHRSAKDEDECREKIRKLEDQVAAGRTVKVGKDPTVAQLLTTWLTDVVATDLRYATHHRSYGWAVRKHLIPGLGYHRAQALCDDPKPIRDYYQALKTSKSQRGKPFSSSSIHAIHRSFRAALNWAVGQDLIPYNPLSKVRPPRLEEPEITPLYVEEVKRIMAVCDGRRNGTRWTVGLPLGFRQGEALGLWWLKKGTSTRDKPIGMDLETGFVNVAKKAERQKWQHGCPDPVACARPHCRSRPCQPPWQHGCADPAACYQQAWRCQKRTPGTCKTHKRDCPRPCPPGCTDHARVCPQRCDGGIVITETKSEAGKRRAALAKPMLDLMRAHKAQQDAEREAALDLWEDHNLVWCTPLGRPIDASVDRAEWKTVLKEAGVRDARIHDGRHTAATMMLLQGIDSRTVMEIMGWSDQRMLLRYQHVVDELRQEAARRVGTLLWGEDPEPSEAAAEPAVTAEPTPEVVVLTPLPTATGEAFPEGSATDLATTNVIQFRPRKTKRPPTAGGRPSR
jgi:integrase